MKKTELIFNLLAIPFDIAALLAAGLVSYYLRYESDAFFGPVLFDLSVPSFLLILARAIPIIIIIFALFGLYSLRGIRKFIPEFNRVAVGLTIAAFITVILFFFNQTIFPSRFIILAAWILSIVFVMIGRLIIKGAQAVMFQKGYGLHRLVLINGNGAEADVIAKIMKNQRYGYKIVAEYDNADDIINKLEKLFIDDRIDEIVQTNNTVSSEQNLKLLNFARQHGIQFSFVPNLFEVQRNAVELTEFQGIPVISLKNTPLEGWGRVVKRIADIVMSLICIILTLPLFIAIAIAIKLTSPGPIIHTAIRVGRGRNFWFYKFRSMYAHLSVSEKNNNEEANKYLQELLDQSAESNRSGPLYKIKNDPRVTPVGRFIRRTKLDEIPQFYNVLFGHMSMVGPRAHLQDQVQTYRDEHGRIFSIKPGIFGLTQLAQIAWPTLPFEEEIRLDTFYIENWSLKLDAVILLKSAYILVTGKTSEDDY